MPVEQKVTKTIKVFIAPNGQKYEGTAADYYEGRRTPVGDDVAGAGCTDSVPEKAEGVTEEVK